MRKALLAAGVLFGRLEIAPVHAARYRPTATRTGANSASAVRRAIR